jgi:hypothetical protein
MRVKVAVSKSRPLVSLPLLKRSFFANHKPDGTFGFDFHDWDGGNVAADTWNDRRGGAGCVGFRTIG